MIWTVSEYRTENTKRHAGGKARDDLADIFRIHDIKEITVDCPGEEREKGNPLKKLFYHFQVAKIWSDAFSQIGNGDTLILQFPISNHTLLFNSVLKKLKRRNVQVIAFIHDLEILRLTKLDYYSFAQKQRIKLEELDELRIFDHLVVHNDRMKKYIHDRLGVPKEKMETLHIFDYLIPGEFKPLKAPEQFRSVIIAGNLSRYKSGYIYALPKQPDFELYGVNFEGEYVENIHYHGSYLADDLPYHLIGGFGLVWDGDSAETCSGTWGEYLQYNNPHKTSLYLACGIPVIIWEKAALAEYVLSNHAGITVGSLDEIQTKLEQMTVQEYEELKRNAEILSERLRAGENTERVIRTLIK